MSVKKVIKAWVSPDMEESSSHAALTPSPTISLTIKFSQLYGFCPVRIKDIGTSWIILIWTCLIFVLQGAFLLDIFYFVISQNKMFGFFSQNTVTAVLYLSVAVQGTFNQSLNFMILNGWKDLVHALRTLPDHTLNVDCKKTVRVRCHMGISFHVLFTVACLLYLAYISTQPTLHMGMLGQMAFKAQHFLVVGATVVPTMLMFVMCKNLSFHFESLKIDFLMKIGNRGEKKYTVAQAILLSDTYHKLAAAVDSLDSVFSWFLFMATCAGTVTGTFCIYLILASMQPGFQWDDLLVPLVTIQMVCCCVIIQNGYALNESSRLLKKDLLTFSAEKYEPSAYRIIKQLERFLSTEDWGLTVGKFFLATRSLILTLFGVVFSHIMILIELGLYGNEASPTAEDTTN